MSVPATTWIWEHSPVRGTERLVLLAIADRAGPDGTNARPSMPTLARNTRLDVRTVRRIVRKLEAGGHLVVQVGAGPRGTNLYALVMPGPTAQRLPAAAPGAGAPHPRVTAPPPPGRNRAPRTSLNVTEHTPRTRPPARPAAARGHQGDDDERCPRHIGQRRPWCGPCRSEAIAGPDEVGPLTPPRRAAAVPARAAVSASGRPVPRT